MLKQYQDWVLENKLEKKINEDNYLSYFSRFIDEGYGCNSINAVIRDILTEIYEMSICFKGLATTVGALSIDNYIDTELEKFLQGLSYGQEDEKSNKENPKSRRNAKKSGEGKRETCELRRKSPRSRNQKV